MRLSRTTRVPLLNNAPPPPLLMAELPLNTLLLKVVVPLFATAPPLLRGAKPLLMTPFDIVKPEMLTVRFVGMVKIRKLGVPAPVLRITVNFSAPGPLILMSWLMSGSVELRIIGPATPLKLMSIVPQDDLEFASWIAARKVQTAPMV